MLTLTLTNLNSRTAIQPYCLVLFTLIYVEYALSMRSNCVYIYIHVYEAETEFYFQ